jgi:hypothetical protein
MKKKLLAFFAGIGAALAFLAGWLLKGLSVRKAAAITDKEKYEEVKREIENTPAGDLVTAASNADQLRANSAGIAGESKQRLRDRIGKILSGNAGVGTSASGGSGD